MHLTIRYHIDKFIIFGTFLIKVKSPKGELFSIFVLQNKKQRAPYEPYQAADSESRQI